MCRCSCCWGVPTLLLPLLAVWGLEADCGRADIGRPPAASQMAAAAIAAAVEREADRARLRPLPYASATACCCMRPLPLLLLVLGLEFMV
jgi:hypothetical protein